MSIVAKDAAPWWSCLCVGLVTAVCSGVSVGCLGGHDGEEPVASVSQEAATAATAITVVTDHDEVSQARREAETRESDVKREALEGLGEDSFFWIESEFLSRYRLRPERVTAELQRIARSTADADPDTRAAACMLLCQLGDAQGWAGLRELLSGRADALKAGLAALRRLDRENAVVEAMQEHLTDLRGPVVEALASPDSDVRDTAASLCGALGVQEAVPRLRELLRSEPALKKGRIIDAVSQLAPDVELCRVAAKEVADGEPSPYWACSALHDMARHPDPEVARCAVEASADYLAHLPSSSSTCRLAPSVVAEHGSVNEMPLLRSLLEDAGEYETTELLGGEEEVLKQLGVQESNP